MYIVENLFRKDVDLNQDMVDCRVYYICINENVDGITVKAIACI